MRLSAVALSVKEQSSAAQTLTREWTNSKLLRSGSGRGKRFVHSLVFQRLSCLGAVRLFHYAGKK